MVLHALPEVGTHGMQKLEMTFIWVAARMLLSLWNYWRYQRAEKD